MSIKEATLENLQFMNFLYAGLLFLTSTLYVFNFENQALRSILFLLVIALLLYLIFGSKLSAVSSFITGSVFLFLSGLLIVGKDYVRAEAFSHLFYLTFVVITAKYILKFVLQQD